MCKVDKISTIWNWLYYTVTSPVHDFHKTPQCVLHCKAWYFEKPWNPFTEWLSRVLRLYVAAGYINSLAVFTMTRNKGYHPPREGSDTLASLLTLFHGVIHMATSQKTGDIKGRKTQNKKAFEKIRQCCKPQKSLGGNTNDSCITLWGTICPGVLEGKIILSTWFICTNKLHWSKAVQRSWRALSPCQLSIHLFMSIVLLWSPYLSLFGAQHSI